MGPKDLAGARLWRGEGSGKGDVMEWGNPSSFGKRSGRDRTAIRRPVAGVVAVLRHGRRQCDCDGGMSPSP